MMQLGSTFSPCFGVVGQKSWKEIPFFEQESFFVAFLDLFLLIRSPGGALMIPLGMH